MAKTRPCLMRSSYLVRKFGLERVNYTEKSFISLRLDNPAFEKMVGRSQAEVFANVDPDKMKDVVFIPLGENNVEAIAALYGLGWHPLYSKNAFTLAIGELPRGDQYQMEYFTSILHAAARLKALEGVRFPDEDDLRTMIIARGVTDETLVNRFCELRC